MAEATGTYSAEQVERLLICAVCLDRFNNPKILPCQHTFCRSPCLEGLIDRQHGFLRCPECRATHFVPREGAGAFPTNITVSGFLDLPTRRSETPSAAAAPSDRAPSVPVAGKCSACETETDTVKCFHCEAMVCDSCKRLHLGQMKIDIGRLLNQVRRGIPQLSNTISSVEQKSEQLKTRVETVKSEVKDAIDRYCKELKDREKMLHSELETFLQGEQRSLRLHQENVEVELASISSYCDSTETLLNQNETANIPEGDLVSMRKQCSDYMSQIHETASNLIPELREVTFRYEGHPVHSSIMSLGQLAIATPSSVSGSTSNNTQRPAPSSQPSQNTPGSQGRGRWSDVEPVDVSMLENFRVSPSFSYAPTDRSGRRSHSPPQARNTNRTQYTRPTHSSFELSSNNRYQGFNPGQTLPSVRNMPSRTNDYLFRMREPSSEDLLDIMDRNRQEEINRRQRGGGRIRASLLAQERARRERVAGLMGGGAMGVGAGYSTVPEISSNSGYNVIPHISTGTGSSGSTSDRSSSQDQSTADTAEISRAAAEAAERRARNTALTRNTETRPAAAFIIPLNGGPLEEINPERSATGSRPPQPAPRTTQAQSSVQQTQDQQPQSQQDQQPQQQEQQQEQQQPQPAEEPSQPATNAEEPVQQTSGPDNAQPSSSQQEQQPASNTTAQDEPAAENQRQPTPPAGPSSQPEQQPTQQQAQTRTQGRPKKSNNDTQNRRGQRRKRVARTSSNNESSTSGERPTRINQSNSTNTTNANPDPPREPEPSTSAPTASESPRPVSRARTVILENGPSTSSANVPVVSSRSSTFDVPITETLGDLDTSEMDHISVDNSTNAGRAIVDYQSKGQMKKQIGGERGNGQGKFTWPRGVAVSPINDSIVVADSSNHRVQMFDLGGHFSSIFGSYGQADGEFDCLAGVAINRTGDIVIADRYNHRIQIFDRYGQFSRSFGEEGTGNGQMNYPWGVATDRGGFIYVCDKENHRIQVFQGNGTFVRKFGSLGSRPGQLENPHYITVGHDCHVYVSDCSNHRVQVFTDTGRFMKTIGNGEGSDNGQLKFPKGIAVDRQGFIIVADSGNNRVQVFRGDGRFYCAFGSWGTDAGQFKGMEGLALSSNGDIVISDKENHRVQIL